MAREPGAGQPKKLHPLFAAAKTGPTSGDGASVGTESVHRLGQTGGQASMQPPVPAAAAIQLPILDPITTASTSGVGQPTNTIPPEREQQVATAAVYPEPPTSAPVNAFDKLQSRKRPEAGSTDSGGEARPQTSEPRRRGRPPKKQKPAPAAPEQALGDVEQHAAANLSEGVAGGDSAAEGVSSSASLPPKRLLKLNPKTGTIGSPPKPKAALADDSARANGKTAPKVKAPKAVVVPYGAESDIARLRVSVMIDAVLSGKCRVFPQQAPIASKTETAKKGLNVSRELGAPSTQPPKTAEPAAKSTHPFFAAGRRKVAPVQADASGTSSTPKNSAGEGPTKYYSSTPCSPKRPRNSAQITSGFKMPQFGAKNGILRVPGACLPAWPWKGAVHVRPEGESSLLLGPRAATLSPPPLSVRKQKTNAVHIRANELILNRTFKSLNIKAIQQDIRDAIGEDFAQPPPDLRLPRRRIEIGSKLRACVKKQLRTQHPGLQSLFSAVATTLSAFDQHQCESLSWTQKYAPASAIEVLQGGAEPLMLRDWLVALKVVSVDTGQGDSGDAGNGKAAKGKAKRKRKKNKLDGFIVSSDDEDDDLGDTSDNEADWSASGRFGLQKKTVVRPGSLLDEANRAGARLTNAVVISGPHGCGKSAAVYAVAKELGYEVFEINASSRRSGKDVVDRIGDMTRNHLVQHKKKSNPFAADASAEPANKDDLLTLDMYEDAEGDPDPDFPTPAPLPTRQQPTMSSFFKPSGASSAKGGKQGKDAEQNGGEKKTPQSQKQSLILLEEADILYDEDKQFWATVMGLIARSKRPFVITCNDETLLPLQSLPLHGIFRFTPPPTECAVDRLLLIAACEGHALKRDAVQSLFEARDHDFRASLVDLQFWCQIGIGDRRGGFDWFFQRWPEGVDMEDGEVMRVVSEGTYQQGMGWVSYDTATVSGGPFSRYFHDEHAKEAAEADLVQQTWNNWEFDLGRWQDTLDMATWASELDMTGMMGNPAPKGPLLQIYSHFADAMSSADIASSMAFATMYNTPFDATQPKLLPKVREDYIAGQQLLERTTVAHENDVLRRPITTAIRCSAKRILKMETGAIRSRYLAKPIEPDNPLDFLGQEQVVASIRKQHATTGGVVPSDVPSIGRIDFSLAFDPISVSDSVALPPGSSAYHFTGFTSGPPPISLDPSVFDRNMAPLVVDVAPFVRSIVAHDGRLQKHRQRLSSILSNVIPSMPGDGTPAGAMEFAAIPPAGYLGYDGPPDMPELSGSGTASRRPPSKRMRTTRAALSAIEGGPRSTTRRDRWFYGDINPVLVMRTGGEDWSEVAREELLRLSREGSKAAADAAAAAAAQGMSLAEAAEARGVVETRPAKVPAAIEGP